MASPVIHRDCCDYFRQGRRYRAFRYLTLSTWVTIAVTNHSSPYQYRPGWRTHLQSAASRLEPASYLQLLENRYEVELDEEAREFIEFAVDGADRMREMVEALHTYSQIEESDPTFEPTDLDAGAGGE